MIPYIPHVALLICLCLVFYKIFLEKETFFRLNRWLLLACAIMAFSLPLFEVPEEWSIWEGQTATQQLDLSYYEGETAATPLPESADESQTSSSNSQLEESTVAPTATEKAQTTDKAKFISYLASVNWLKMLWYTYLVGLAIFGINLLIQLLTLLVQIYRSPCLKDGPYRIVEMSQDKAPYSFMNCIFINPTKYDWETYNQILEHEKIHIQQWHSLDMILAEILVVLQWFNPLAWQYRKAIENNLEYLTDSAMLHKGAAREPYQLNLLKVSVPQYPVGLAMNYNQSFLKKRIKMMNAKKSSVRTSWKYLAIIPLLGLSILCLNAVQVAAKQDKNTDLKANLEQVDDQISTALAPMDQQLSNNISGQITSQISRSVTENITDNITQEVTQNIEQQWGDIAQRATKQLKSPLNEKSSLIGGTSPMEMRGMWQAEISGDRVCVRFDNSNFERNSFWISTECFKRSDFSDLPTTEGEFSIDREAGKVNFKGKFEDDYGMGRYTFAPSADFAKFLQDQGIRGEAKEETMFHFFLSNIDKAYVTELKREGYRGLDMKQLKKLAIHDVDREYIRAMAQAGYSDLSLSDLVKGRIHDVDPAYIKELNDLGFKNMDFDELVKFAIHDVDTELVEELSRAGFDNLDPEDIVKASIHNVDADYIRELKEVGYELDRLEDEGCSSNSASHR